MAGKEVLPEIFCGVCSYCHVLSTVWIPYGIKSVMQLLGCFIEFLCHSISMVLVPFAVCVESVFLSIAFESTEKYAHGFCTAVEIAQSCRIHLLFAQLLAK